MLPDGPPAIEKKLLKIVRQQLGGTIFMVYTTGPLSSNNARVEILMEHNTALNT